MRIGEIAQQSSVPAKTIRYYEDIGVLDRPARTTSGYRDYDAAAIQRLRFIKSSQSVGLTLGEIREIVALRERGQTPCAHVAEVIERHAAEIDDKIADLERMRSEVRRLAIRARTLDPKDCDPAKICHIIEPVSGRGAR